MQILNSNPISRTASGFPGAEASVRAPNANLDRLPLPAQTQQPTQSDLPRDPRGSANRQQVEAAVEQVQRSSLMRGSQLSFQIDDTSERLVVRILDSDTRDVIRQIPSEEFLRMSQALESFEEQALRASVEMQQMGTAGASGMLLRESA